MAGMEQEQTFFWGVSTSAYQSEGGYNGPGQPHNNWALVEKQGRVETTGATSEFWTRYEEDFRHCQDMGLNAFRLGLEWTRLQPERPESLADIEQTALVQYAKMIASCRDFGMEPIVTLHHFTHPVWLGSDAWLDSATAGAFAEFAVALIRQLNDQLEKAHQQEPLKYFITINEPNMLALNTYFGRQFPSQTRSGPKIVMRAYDTLLNAHLKCYQGLHALYRKQGWSTPKISLNTYCSDCYWNDLVLWHSIDARRRGVKLDDVSEFLRFEAREFDKKFRRAKLPLSWNLPRVFGTFVHQIGNAIGRKHFKPSNLPESLRTLYETEEEGSFDFVGLDYYDPFVSHTFRFPRLSDIEQRHPSFRAWMMNAVTSKWWDWRVLPKGLHFFCQTYTDSLQRPIFIAENGMALARRWNNRPINRRDGMTRSEFLRLHVAEVCRMRAEEIPIMGYMHWSLTDNYEWGSFTPRFGLFTIDYHVSRDRIAYDHLEDCPSETYRGLVANSCRLMEEWKEAH
ncbi:MAG: family 1 glycosylhydrolase [Verrucomicrobiales bacterium]